MAATKAKTRGAPARPAKVVARSGTASQAKTVERIVSGLRAQLEQLTDTALAEIFSEIPAYETTVDPAFVKDVREHIHEHYAAVLDTLERNHRVTPEDLLFVRKHAAQRVGQVSVANFIHAFQVGQHVLLDHTVALATDEESRQAVLSLVSLIPRYFDVVIAHAADVYLEAEQLLASTGERVRRDLLEDLLAEEPVPPGPRLDAARAAGLDQRTPCLVIVALPTTSISDPHALRAGATALARACGQAVQPLTVVRHDEIVVVTPSGPGEPRALAERVAEAQRRLASRGLALAVGVSTVYEGSAAAGPAYREAVSARDRLLGDPGVVALPAMTMFDYLTGHGDGTVRRLVPPAIERFVAEDRATGEALLQTLQAYAAADLNVKHAAEQLHVHVNTAHYRLARISERTGCDLRRVSDVIELLIAARLPGAA
jgi:sugar diacid utilization regulator